MNDMCGGSCRRCPRRSIAMVIGIVASCGLLGSCAAGPDRSDVGAASDSKTCAKDLSDTEDLRVRIFAAVLRGETTSTSRHELAVRLGETRSNLEKAAAGTADRILKDNLLPVLMFAWNPLGERTEDALTVFGEPTRRVERNGAVLLYYERAKPMTAMALVLTAGARCIERVEWLPNG